MAERRNNPIHHLICPPFLNRNRREIILNYRSPLDERSLVYSAIRTELFCIIARKFINKKVRN